jgi:cell division protein ZapE
LLTHLFLGGVVLLATSNYPPDGLYPDGLQRVNFLPTIALLKEKLDVLHLDGGEDHRRRELARAALYHTPLDPQAEQELTTIFDRLAMEQMLDPQLTVLGRTLRARRHAPGVVWFDFLVLCGDQRSQLDYLQLAREYGTLIVSGVRRMTPGDAALARRLTWLVDVLYDYRVKLVLSAECPPEELYPAGLKAEEFTRTVSRLIEMQTESYLALAHSQSADGVGVIET